MIVLDSSTLILLSKIDMLGTFVSNLREKIVMPEKVKEETCLKGEAETPLIEKLIANHKILVIRLKNNKLAEKLMEDFHIDAGEAEAVALAFQKKPSLVATDDRNAMRACKMMGIDFTTAIAVLIRAFEKNLVDKDDALIKLQKLEGVARYSRRIIEDARNRIGGGD